MSDGLILASFLFCLGLTIVLTRRDLIFILLGIELMLNGANLNFIIFSSNDKEMQGQIFAVFVVVIAAAEIVIALALMINLYRHFKSTDSKDFSGLGN